MLRHNWVLKSDELFLVGDGITGNDGRQPGGLYLRDTRFLDRFEVRLNGLALDDLSSRLLGPASAVIVSANEAPVPTHPDEDCRNAPARTISLEQHIVLTADLRVRFVLRNSHQETIPLRFSLALGADFRDLFAIRGFAQPEQTGRWPAAVITPDSVVFSYADPRDNIAVTRIDFNQTAASVHRTDNQPLAKPANADGDQKQTPENSGHGPRPSVVANFDMTLPHNATWELTVTMTPVPIGARLVAAAPDDSDRSPRTAPVITSNPRVNEVLTRSTGDLAMLQTTFDQGSLPAAGIPWYVAPFGRDSLIVGLQTLHLAPRNAANTLRFLASLQGTKVDLDRGEEPGKILHEVRYGELARLGAIPHTPYYGTVDATPLFILLFAETVAWTNDARLYADLLPNVRRALDWIEHFGDLDGDGLIEYASQTSDANHLAHQGWKDSFDSLNHLDGRPATGAIALVEAQGYVFAAYRRLASVVDRFGEQAWAVTLRQRADRIQALVEHQFWMDGAGFYAQALDGDKQPVGAVSSNPGHLLFCELPSTAHAQRVAARFRRPDLDSGWGIRTLSTEMAHYNPMSYHNGSVWPHDNSLIAAGLRNYGLTDDANRIAGALFGAAATDPLARLPELYCGFARTEEAAAIAPVNYPVSCSPQAWAAAAPWLLARTMLGLRVDDGHERLLVDPALPEWLDQITIPHLEVFGRPASLTVRRDGAGYLIDATGPVRELAITTPA